VGSGVVAVDDGIPQFCGRGWRRGIVDDPAGVDAVYVDAVGVGVDGAGSGHHVERGFGHMRGCRSKRGGALNAAITRCVTIATVKQTPIIDPTLKQMVDRIVQENHPEKIILFGSRARGTAEPDSDYDLLIVAHVNGSLRQYRREIYHSLYELRLPVGKDIIVATPNDIKRSVGLIGTVLTPAMREGLVLYDRAA